MGNFPKKEIVHGLIEPILMTLIIAVFFIEKFAKYIFKHNGKLDLAYGKFFPKKNSAWIDWTYY